MSLLALLVLVGAAAGGLEVVEPLGAEELLLLPHAARPTTAAAARTEAANHRLRIVFSPFVTVSPLRVHTKTRTIRRNRSARSDRRQADIRSHSQASES